MAQVDNEYGSYGADYAYLAHIRDVWKSGLGEGVVIHSTDQANSQIMTGSRIPGVLQTVDFGIGDPSGPFSVLKASQQKLSSDPKPLMCSEIYPGNLVYWGGSSFPSPNPATMFVETIDQILNMSTRQATTNFVVWLFASNTDFGFWGGTLFLGQWRSLVPSYDFGAPVDEAGKLRPLFYMMRDLLQVCVCSL